MIESSYSRINVGDHSKSMKQLEQWDIWIKDGQASKVRSLCRQLNHKKIARELLIEYAQVARRVGASDLIILWLRPIVRSEKILSQAPTESEKALYALGLLRLGAFREARQILSEIDPEKDPQMYFYRASLHINQWSYGKAIPDLKKYIKHPKVSSYSKLVGQLNLSAALVSTFKFEQAEQQISSLLKKLPQEKSSLLKGNLLEIRSQLLYEEGRYAEALDDLEKAAHLLNKADERSLLYVQKWRLIIQLKTHHDKKAVLTELENLKNRATEIGEWESVRDCDLHRALVLKDRDLILKVYWGSRFEAYKKRILNLFGPLDTGSKFILKSHTDSNNRSAPTLDLVDSAPTPILKKLFFILTREFYQPLRITEILDEIYSNEFYHPLTSPAKLHRLIARGRQWMSKQGFPIDIKSYQNSFKLEFLAPCNLVLSKDLQSQKEQLLPQVTAQEFFSAKDWALEKQISERAARNQILKLVKLGQLEIQKRGPKTRYKKR